MSFTTIFSEGNLIPADLLERIATGDTDGQQSTDFGLDKSTRLTDEIATAWSDARAFWDVFGRTLRRLREDDPATTATRERWIVPLLELLGYTLTYMPTAAVVEQRTYAISHRAGSDESAPPVHIEGARRSLDLRAASGRPRLSPHALVQEYLNSTEHLWGIVTNGYKLRLLRDSSRTSRPTYVEFDLQAMLDGEKFSEFALLYRLLHRTRLPQTIDDAPRCLLERYHQQAIEAGGRVREGLRNGVETALRALGNGLLQHSDSTTLRTALASGTLSHLDYYRELLRLVYRLLFLMVAEERGLVSGTEQGLAIYRQYYSVSRLRRLAEKPGAGRGGHSDLWQGLLATFRVFEDDDAAQVMGLAALDGDLFGPEAIKHLEQTGLANATLLNAIHALSLYHDPQTKALRRINYSALDVEELGSVYESLLDYRPLVQTRDDLPVFDLVTGTERKTTGSYYTRPELVQELIKSALEPVLAERLAAAGSDPAARERAILRMTVCDPACGSGHFLLAAARRLGRELARVRSGEDQPGPEQFRRAVRDVIAHCIYGVDANPLAVDLCKLALWIEGFNAGMPLSFLDSHIRWGNSLIGARRDLIEHGIPDDAFQPVTGDDKAAAAAIRKRNARERKAHESGQAMLPLDYHTDRHDTLVRTARALDDAPDTTVQAVRAKARQFNASRGPGSAWYDEWTRYNLWTAAFFLPLTSADDPANSTTQTVLDFDRSPASVHGMAVGAANGLSHELGFFHWELEFAQVFGEDGSGGFDVVLGNPPWEMLQLEEQEFFASRDLDIANARNKATRERLIRQLSHTNPLLANDFNKAIHAQDAINRFIRASKRFPLTALGRMNTYALFSEHARDILTVNGQAGIIVPTGIATDDTTKVFFGDLNRRQQVVSLYDFENRENIFPGVGHGRYKFCLLTIGATDQPTRFSFFATNIKHLEDSQRVFQLTPEDIALLNPNTRTCPVFRTNADAELTKKSIVVCQYW